MNKITSRPSKGFGFPMQKNQAFLCILAISLLLFPLLSACVTPATEEAIPCNKVDERNYSCGGANGHEITLADVPDNVFPRMIPVSSKRDIELREAPKEETGCIFMVAGDLAFYDENGELIPDLVFDSPITISYAFLEQDQDDFSNCQTTLVEQGVVGSVEEVTYLPVYFDKDLWRPFKEENVQFDGNVMKITFTSWGDQPIGGGTKP